MRLAFFAALTVVPALASAAELPINGAYGDQVTCGLYLKGGIDAVSYDGADTVLVTKNRIIGHEWECSIAGMKQSTVRLDCGAAGDGGKGSLRSASIKVDITNDTVIFDDHRNDPTTLRRCVAPAG